MVEWCYRRTPYSAGVAFYLSHYRTGINSEFCTGIMNNAEVIGVTVMRQNYTS